MVPLMFFTPETRDRNLLPHDPLKAIVAPRPIGWISTLSKSGTANLAPYSFFNAVGGMPPILMFSSEGVKDSARNALETGEFVFNYPGQNLVEEMNASSVPAPSGISEFEYLDIASAESQTVAPPRVAEAHAALECKVTGHVELVDVNGDKTGAITIFGQVTGVYINDEVIKNGRFDVSIANPVTRLGYLDFGMTGKMFEMERPGFQGQKHNP